MEGSISMGFMVHDKKGTVNKLKEKLEEQNSLFLDTKIILNDNSYNIYSFLK
jgi:hypothetical protein